MEIPPRKEQTIQKLLGSGKYESVHQFLLAAIENQLALEDYEIEGTPSVPTNAAGSTTQSAVSADGSLAGSVLLVKEPTPERVNGTSLWTLHNRIFPVKVTLRVLAKILLDQKPSDGYVSINTLGTSAVAEATRLGKILQAEDDRKSGGNRLATGLITKSNSKSRERFQNSFVGSVVHAKDGRTLIDGAPGRLRLVDVRINQANKELQFGLTYAGQQFAIMNNPILDNHTYESSLSGEEADWYIGHIREKLPREYSSSIDLLYAISRGKNTPAELAAVSDSEETDRASRVGRLSELGAIDRARLGVRVQYSITDRGKRWLGNLGKVKSMEPRR